MGDDIFGEYIFFLGRIFCFLVCFAMLNALCWIISVMFLFRLSMSSSMFFYCYEPVFLVQFELKRVLLRSNNLSVNSCSCQLLV